MKTREQITVTGDFPPLPVPGFGTDAALPELAERANAEAERKGLVITDFRETMTFTVVWLRNNGTADSPALGECMRAEADTARVTLNVWAEPA